MATVVDWPPQVLAAAALKFTTPVGAFLWMPEVEFPCLVGRVFMDLSSRFQDGRMIRTSQIIRLQEERGWTIAITFSGSYYLLVHEGENPYLGQTRLFRSNPGDAVSNLH